MSKNEDILTRVVERATKRLSVVAANDKKVAEKSLPFGTVKKGGD